MGFEVKKTVVLLCEVVEREPEGRSGLVTKPLRLLY